MHNAPERRGCASISYAGSLRCLRAMACSHADLFAPLSTGEKMKALICLVVLLFCRNFAVADGLVQPVYGSPKYSVKIWNPGTGNQRGGGGLDSPAYDSTSPYATAPVYVAPFIWWVVEVGEVYIVDGYSDRDHLLIRVGEARMIVPADCISLIPPGSTDYAKAEKLYSEWAKKEAESRIRRQQQMDAQQRAADAANAELLRSLRPSPTINVNVLPR